MFKVDVDRVPNISARNNFHEILSWHLSSARWHGHFWDIWISYICNCCKGAAWSKEEKFVNQPICWDLNENCCNCVWIPKDDCRAGIVFNALFSIIFWIQKGMEEELYSSSIHHYPNIPPPSHPIPSPCHKYCWCKKLRC